jgi:hypothetical protein
MTTENKNKKEVGMAIEIKLEGTNVRAVRVPIKLKHTISV